jgi:hypothetical protein
VTDSGRNVLGSYVRKCADFCGQANDDRLRQSTSAITPSELSRWHGGPYACAKGDGQHRLAINVGHKEVAVTQLRKKVLEELERHNYSQATANAYVRRSGGSLNTSVGRPINSNANTSASTSCTSSRSASSNPSAGRVIVAVARTVVPKYRRIHRVIGTGSDGRILRPMYRSSPTKPVSNCDTRIAVDRRTTGCGCLRARDRSGTPSMSSTYVKLPVRVSGREVCGK